MESIVLINAPEIWGICIFTHNRLLYTMYEVNNMPVRKVQGGYQWGQSGKVYPTREQAERQGRAIYRSGYREETNRQTTKRNK